MRFVFKPWRRLTANYDEGRGFSRYLDAMASTTAGKLRAGLNSSQKSGRLYRYRGATHRASAPGEYPARRTGRLAGSVRIDRGPLAVTVGTSTKYAKYLRTGTRRMKRRNMSDTALKEARRLVKGRFSRLARFRYL